MADEKNLAAQPAKEGKGEFSAQPAEEEKEQEQEQQPEGKQGEFSAEEEEDKKKQKSPGYTPYDWGQSDNISDFMVDAFSGALSNWFIANLQWVGHYIDTSARWANRFMDGKAKNPQALSANNNKNNGNSNGGNQTKPNTQNKDQNKDKDKNNGGRQGSFTAEAATPDRNNNRGNESGANTGAGSRQGIDPVQQKRNEAKAKNTEKQYDKVKKNVSKRKYPKTPEGKNQEAFDKMTLDSLKKEVEYRKNVAKNPDFAQTPEGRKARAELVGDRKALAAMQKETGVDTKVTDGIIKNKSKAKKKNRGNKHTSANKKRSKISTKNFGEQAKSNTGVRKSAKQSLDKGVRSVAGQDANLKKLYNLKDMLNTAGRPNLPATREQTNTQTNVAIKKRQAGKSM